MNSNGVRPLTALSVLLHLIATSVPESRATSVQGRGASLDSHLGALSVAGWNLLITTWAAIIAGLRATPIR